MTKSIVLSIQAQHALNIMDGYKTLELRKRVPKSFKGWVYVYVTKAKPKIYKDKVWETDLLNGTIPFRFWFDEYDIIEVDSEQHNAILKKVCLTINSITTFF